jgi:putative ABC transport system permease protein
MFDVPFLYGGGWNAKADWSPEPVIVLSRTQNQRLFGGTNSVGRTVRWHDREFRVIGVLDRWRPTPKFYDLNNYEFEAAEDVFVPIGWASVLQVLSAGNNSCWGAEIKTYEAYLQADCAWIQMWVELPDSASRERFQTFLANYRNEQHKLGRFTRPAERSRLYNVDEWLNVHDVAGTDNRILLGLAGAFLIVCLINTVGLLLAKFMKSAPIAGVRRALGASRREIFLQHLTEVGVLSAAGALLSLALGWLGMWGLRALHNLGTFDSPEGPPDLARIDTTSVAAAVTLAVAATLVAGLYPAWRAGRLNPAAYLKSQ